MIKIALIGYGKMGRMIDLLASEDKEISIERKFEYEDKLDDIDDIDVFIDFSHPDTVIKNIEVIASKSKGIVVGTTGWYDRIDYVESLIYKKNASLIWSGNFSIGVNIFFKIVEVASKLSSQFKYDASIIETHHTQKKDAPSGTALMLGDIMLKNIDYKKNIKSDIYNQDISQEDINISSNRLGSVVGKHEIILDSVFDCIKLSHVAKSREGFALGAIEAAKFIYKRKGFYHINDMMKYYFNS